MSNDNVIIDEYNNKVTIHNHQDFEKCETLAI